MALALPLRRLRSLTARHARERGMKGVLHEGPSLSANSIHRATPQLHLTHRRSEIPINCFQSGHASDGSVTLLSTQVLRNDGFPTASVSAASRAPGKRPSVGPVPLDRQSGDASTPPASLSAGTPQRTSRCPSSSITIRSCIPYALRNRKIPTGEQAGCRRKITVARRRTRGSRPGAGHAGTMQHGSSAASVMPWIIFLSGGQNVASAPDNSARPPITK